jgi:hypothetical protein
MRFISSTRIVTFLLCSLLLGLSCASSASSSTHYSLVSTVSWTPKLPTSVDQAQAYNGLLYMADRSNGALHIVSFNSTGNATELASVKNFTGLVVTEHNRTGEISRLSVSLFIAACMVIADAGHILTDTNINDMNMARHHIDNLCFCDQSCHGEWYISDYTQWSKWCSDFS